MISKIIFSKKVTDFNLSRFLCYPKRLHTNPGLIPKIPPKEHAHNPIPSMHFKFFRKTDQIFEISIKNWFRVKCIEGMGLRIKRMLFWWNFGY